jgi:outer membrane receptor for monomeric catechols
MVRNSVLSDQLNKLTYIAAIMIFIPFLMAFASPVTSSDLEGVILDSSGAGGRYYSSQVGDMTDTFRIPGYGLADAAVFYRHGRFRLQLNANNLLNKRYFTGSYDQYYVLPGAPRNSRVTLGWTF